MRVSKEFIDANKGEDTAINIIVYPDSDIAKDDIRRHRKSLADFNKLIDLVEDGSDEAKSLVRMHNNTAMLAYEEIHRKANWQEGINKKEANIAMRRKKLRAAAAERWEKKHWHTPNAVAKYLIDEGITTLKNRRVRDIIKDLEPQK